MDMINIKTKSSINDQNANFKTKIVKMKQSQNLSKKKNLGFYFKVNLD